MTQVDNSQQGVIPYVHILTEILPTPVARRNTGAGMSSGDRHISGSYRRAASAPVCCAAFVAYRAFTADRSGCARNAVMRAILAVSSASRASVLAL